MVPGSELESSDAADVQQKDGAGKKRKRKRKTGERAEKQAEVQNASAEPHTGKDGHTPPTDSQGVDEAVTKGKSLQARSTGNVEEPKSGQQKKSMSNGEQ